MWRVIGMALAALLLIVGGTGADQVGPPYSGVSFIQHPVWKVVSDRPGETAVVVFYLSDGEPDTAWYPVGWRFPGKRRTPLDRMRFWVHSD